jgi:hypothetical protein
MTINDPHDCLDKLFLVGIIPAPIPSLQLSVRWIDFASAICKLLDRIEKLEAELKEVTGRGSAEARTEEGI